MYKTTSIILAVFLIFLFSFCGKEPDTPVILKEWKTYYSNEDWKKDSTNYTKLTGDTVSFDSFIVKFSTIDTLKWSTWYGEGE